LPRHDQRTGIVPAVGVEQRPLPPKQASIGGRYPIAAVFTGDQEAVSMRSNLSVGMPIDLICYERDRLAVLGFAGMAYRFLLR
jgi:hypothetical protein